MLLLFADLKHLIRLICRVLQSVFCPPGRLTPAKIGIKVVVPPLSQATGTAFRNSTLGPLLIDNKFKDENSQKRLMKVAG